MEARWAALLILIFTALVTLVFHHFWSASPDEAMTQQLMFLKNVLLWVAC